LRAELGLHNRELLIGSVGNIRKPKAYDVLIHAAARVLERLPGVHFAIVGAQAEGLMAPLLSLRRELGLESKVHFLGLRKASPELYQNFDLFVSSSTSEGLPLSFLEAMASGCPIVATASGGAEQLLGDNKLGLIVPINSPHDLAQAILKLLGDSTLRARLARTAREQVIARYGLDTMIGRYRKIYGCAWDKVRPVQEASWP
jgi:glycosyltransferase involved in cell wall biosynthesis